MNAREKLKIKPKTIRLAILMALSDGAITTIDDLQIRMDEPRKKVVDNAVHAANDDLIKRLRDDITGGPAYQITAKGREHLASFSGEKEEAAARSEHSELSPPPSAVSATPILGGVSEVIEAKNAEIDRLKHECEVAEKLVESMHAAADECFKWLAMASVFGCSTPAQLAERIRLLTDRFVPPIVPAGYIIQCPGMPFTRFSKKVNAENRAMASARRGKRAAVFALLPVGVAVRGAEWITA